MHRYMSASEEMRPDIPADAGFTLTEVLVALVVVGFIAAATGALASFAVATRDRAREVEAKIASFRDLQGFADIIAANPAERFNLSSKGHIAIGKDADIVLIKPNAPYTLQTEDLEYKNKISRFSFQNSA